MTEYSSLQGAYERSGRDGLIASIQQRIADSNFADNVYMLADPSLAVLAGNLREWPPTTTAASGWIEFRASEALPNAANRPLLRAMLETLPSGDRLLVGRDISDLDSFADQIRTAVISAVALMFVIAGVASILVTRRTVGRIESINATSRAIMQSGLDQRIPLRGTHDEWDRVAENLNLMLDRIETLMGEVRQVSDNVAHDLRTPLTRMRGRLEKAYHGQRIGEDDEGADRRHDRGPRCRLADILVADTDCANRDPGTKGRVPHRESGGNRRRGCRAVRCRGRTGGHPPHRHRRSRGAGDRRSRPDLRCHRQSRGQCDQAWPRRRASRGRQRKHRWQAGHLDRRRRARNSRPTNTSRYSSAFTGSNTAATRRETVWGSAWSLLSPIFTARGSKCLITRRVSSSNSGFPLRFISREQVKPLATARRGSASQAQPPRRLLYRLLPVPP